MLRELLGAGKNMKKLGVQKELNFVRNFYVEMHFLSQLRQGTPEAPILQEFGRTAMKELPRAARSCQDCQELPGAARSCQKLPRAARSCQELAEAARSCQELPGAGQSCQELPGAAQSCPELPRAVQSCPELPRATQNCQELPRAAQS